MPPKVARPGHRKIVEFDDEVWHALTLLSRDSLLSLQELADEAFSDLLHKHGRPVTLKEALLASTPKERPAVRKQRHAPSVTSRSGTRRSST